MTILALVIVKIYASKERGHFLPPPLQSYKVFKKPSRNKVKAKSRARDFLRIY